MVLRSSGQTSEPSCVGSPAFGELDHHAKADRAARKTRLQLFDEKIGGLLLGVRLAQVVLAGNGKKPVASARFTPCLSRR